MKIRSSLSLVLILLTLIPSVVFAQTTPLYVSASMEIAPTPQGCCGWSVSIAASLVDRNKLVASNGVWAYSSDDGGFSWTQTWSGPGGNPSIAYDANGAVFLTRLQARPDLHVPSYVGVMKSPDGGSSWNDPVMVATSPDSTVFFLDKPWVAVDTSDSSFRNRVYLVFNNYTTTRGDVLFAFSKDDGMTFSKPRRLVVGDPYGIFPPKVATGPRGEVYVAWEVTTPHAAWIKIIKSTNGGESFNVEGMLTENGPTAVSVTPGPSPLPNTKFRVNFDFSLAVDQRTGFLYLVWQDYRNGDSDIYFSRSLDGGTSWSAPLRVNDDPVGDGKDQFMPALALSTDGTIHVAFLDRRNDPSDISFEVYYTRSENSGASFDTNVKVSDFSSNANTLSDPSFIGDYVGLAVDLNGVVHPIWNGVRNGVGATYTVIISQSPITQSVLTTTMTAMPSSTSTSMAPSTTALNEALSSGVIETISTPVTSPEIGTILLVAVIVVIIGAALFFRKKLAVKGLGHNRYWGRASSERQDPDRLLENLEKLHRENKINDSIYYSLRKEYEKKRSEKN